MLLNYKILILTSIYPISNTSRVETPVVHYFTREWVKLGYDVRVIHYAVNFNWLIYMLAKPLKNWLASYYGTYIRTSKLNESCYTIDGVKVNRIAVRKNKPHDRYSSDEIDAALAKTISYLNEENFSPNVIISHWANPQLEIMHRLKLLYKIPTCYIAHTKGLNLKDRYSNEISDYIAETNLIGYRSNSIKSAFERIYKVIQPTFMCYSGIPEFYLQLNYRNFETIRNFIFVGSLIRPKYPSVIIPAVCNTYKKEDFKITYVGSGVESKRIKSLAIKYHCTEKINQTGFLERSSVVELLKQHDVFIMISRSEAFGLAYLEAMACGCITIASKGEGFDGIIRHGKNGFLCEAGNEEELTVLIRHIKSLSLSVINQISQNAINTARELTNKKMAVRYLDSVLRVLGEN